MSIRHEVKGSQRRGGPSSRGSGINIPDPVLFEATMPLLPKEADCFPDELFALPAGSSPWHVAHVRSRQEKVLARHLFDQLVPFYLPQIERVTERSSRRFHSFVPLFAGYLFFRGRDDARDAALRSGVTVRIIDVDDHDLLGAQLEQIRCLQLAGASFEVYEELLPNDAVTITKGAFSGYTGAVVRSGRGDRLVVSLSLLRKSIAVEFARPLLRRARR
jgi:hypothetical protein